MSSPPSGGGLVTVDVRQDNCKQDGWEHYGIFENQGDCVGYVATGGTNLPG